MKTIQNLRILKSFLSPVNWSKVGLAKNCFDETCDPNDEDACQFCTSGALIKLFPDPTERKEISDALTSTANKIIEEDEFIDGGTKIHYLYEYDYVSTFSQIVELIDRTIEMQQINKEVDEIFTI